MRTVRDLLDILDSRGKKLSLAESCTGGLIGSMITEVPGSSSCFLGSAVTYSNDAKENILGVRHETLLAFGAVSPQTAEEMATGSLRAYGSDVAASVTGIAGPGGAVEGKPVGTVCVCITDGKRMVTTTHHFDGDRRSVRQQTAESVIDGLCDFLGGKS